jgi:hypothetical protein
MKEILKKTIEILKEKVKSNLFEIQNNQKEIRNLLNQPVSEERSSELEERYATNKILLTENNDFINVQLTLTNFYEKYNDSDVFRIKEMVSVPVQQMNMNECFEQTIDNKIAYNEDHPYYNDDKFFQKLIHYYEKLEDYERCSQLVKEKNQG